MYVWLRFKTRPKIRNIFFECLKQRNMSDWITDYLSCTYHLTSLNASLHVCTFSMFSLNRSSCSVKAWAKVPVYFDTLDGSTLLKVGKTIIPFSFIHSMIFASSSKHQVEVAKFFETMTIANLDFSIALKSSTNIYIFLSQDFHHL